MKPTLVLLGLLPLLLPGCGFVFSQGPPTGHEQMESFTCTESNAGPILDIVWASLNVLGALGAASDPSAYENSGEIVAVGLGWGVFSSFSAASGFNKSKQCKLALRQLAERQGPEEECRRDHEVEHRLRDEGRGERRVRGVLDPVLEQVELHQIAGTPRNDRAGCNMILTSHCNVML